MTIPTTTWYEFTTFCRKEIHQYHWRKHSAWFHPTCKTLAFRGEVSDWIALMWSGSYYILSDNRGTNILCRYHTTKKDMALYYHRLLYTTWFDQSIVMRQQMTSLNNMSVCNLMRIYWASGNTLRMECLWVTWWEHKCDTISFHNILEMEIGRIVSILEDMRLTFRQCVTHSRSFLVRTLQQQR